MHHRGKKCQREVFPIPIPKQLKITINGNPRSSPKPATIDIKNTITTNKEVSQQ